MYIQRMNAKSIEMSFENGFITAVLGPRRIGKTSLVMNYVQRNPDKIWVSLNMDDMFQRERVKKMQLSEMISEGARQVIGENKIWVTIDEAQKCPELFDQIKILYDCYKDQDKIKWILTGSAILSLHRLSAESLAGRIELHYLSEFNLREQSLLTELSMPTDSLLDQLVSPDEEGLSDYMSRIMPYKPILKNNLDQTLVWGGFPELLSLDSLDRKILYLNNYLQTYLEKDVQSVESILDLMLYRRMMDIFAEQTGSVRDDNCILQALHCARDTLKKYRGYLEATLLYVDIYPYIESHLKRLVKSPKGYCLNNGLISVLTGITDGNILEKTGGIGHRLENWFLNELRTWLARMPEQSTIYYWRTSSGAEVDFIVVKKPWVYPFEVTQSQAIPYKKLRNLKTFMQDEPKAKWGYFIYPGNFRIDRENRIIYIPSWAVS